MTFKQLLHQFGGSIIIFILCVGSFSLTACHVIPLPELTVQKNSTIDGLKTQVLDDNDLQIIIASIDPSKLGLSVVQNQDSIDNTIKSIHQKNNSVLSFNGSFFDKSFQPLGLLISQGKVLNPVNTQSDLMNGIFIIDQNNNPVLIKATDYNPKNNYKFALQNGPILIDGGVSQIKSDTNKKANRTILGITKDRQIVVIQIRGTMLNQEDNLSLYKTADYLINNPTLQAYQITSAINLDGGPSSGIAFEKQYYPEFATVQNIIITKPLLEQ